MPNKFALAAPLAALFLISTSAAAATAVQIYGVIDMGVSVSKKMGDAKKGVSKAAVFSLNSGQRNSSRWGIKGVEDLGQGWKVIVTLEDQFNADSGQEVGGLWGRESTLAVDGPYGKLTLGSTGFLKSPVGTTALCNTRAVNPFGNVMHNFIPGHKTMTSGSYQTLKNSFTYASPKLQGFQVFGQFSNSMDGDDGAATRKERGSRYFALAGRYQSGPLMATMIVDLIDRRDESSISKDPFTATLAVNYDFGRVRPYLFAQYFHSAPLNTVGSYLTAAGDYNGAGGTFTLLFPKGPGEFKTEIGFMTAKKSEGEKNDVTRYAAAVGYDWPLTKTFHLYGDIGWVGQKTKNTKTVKQSGAEVLIGCVKFF